jgi:murein L,D-transpeptidase YcbB/YkuD
VFLDYADWHPTVLHKTLPHALSRATATSAVVLGTQDRFGQALKLYSECYDNVASARLTLLSSVQTQFLKPWNMTLTNSISHAMKARAAVKSSRLELDARKSALKSASPQRAEQARLEVENAEDDLVQKTEVAIGLMKAVLENPEPIKNLNALAKAQLTYHAAAAEALQAMQGDVEELATAAEGEYR